MNRELKFRCWDDNEMRECEIDMTGYVHVWDDNENDLIIVGALMDGRVPKQIPVMQFTGLSDKNGKDIFERDIIRFGWDVKRHNKLFKDEPGSQIIYHKSSLGRIDFEDGCFVVESILIGSVKYKDKQEYGLDFYGPEGSEFSWDELEIIGNIHENPELLKCE